MNVTPENITELRPDEVFVYGSNRRGINGAGAARLAQLKFGAKHGVGMGQSGPRCFAIPTKDEHIKTMPLAEIADCVKEFLTHAACCPEKKFLVTAIGCGLAGYTPHDIAPLFHAHTIPNNVYLPQSFWDLKP